MFCSINLMTCISMVPVSLLIYLGKTKAGYRSELGDGTMEEEKVVILLSIAVYFGF